MERLCDMALPLPAIVFSVISLVSLVAAFALGQWWVRSGWGVRLETVAKRLVKALVRWVTVPYFTGGAVSDWSVNSHARCRLVGAGPGDPALLTLAARRAIQEADLVIADLLVSEETLRLARGKIILSRKYKGCANKAQEELYQWTLDALRQGLDVVRLKGGDPFLYGRGAEEITLMRHEGFDVEVVPGLSSSLCAPLAAGIAVTTRGVANQLLIATGHGMNDSEPSSAAPYAAGRTTVYLMAVSAVTKLMKRLVNQSGYPQATPVAVVERATSKEQRVVRGTVANIADICIAADVRSPATIIVGHASQALALLDTGKVGVSVDENFAAYQHGEGSVKFFAKKKNS